MARAQLEAMTTVSLSPRQKAALTSFVFNVGIGAYRRSTLRKLVNAGDLVSVPGELKRWVHAGKQRLAGLEARRAAEIALWEG